jgi:uncharacterized protein (TIGR02679 family)
MKNVSDPDRLRVLLGTKALARIRTRMRARLLRSGELKGALTIGDATAEERAEIDALFGRRPSKGRLSIDLNELEWVLRNAGIADSLIDALEDLEGPVLAEREASRADDAAWAALSSTLRTSATNDVSWLQAWWSDLIDGGVLRRLSRGHHVDARRWAEQASGILRRIPFSGVRLAQLAADACGDSHALDDGEPLGTIFVRGVECAVGLVGTESPRRELLAKVGIVADDVSTPVLVLNLRSASSGLLAVTLNRYADAGEPLHVTARQLQREDITFSDPADGVVYACENPTVLAAAADVLGPNCHPLICTSGQARNAARELMRRLRAGGVRVRYHGDFDWPGIAIARGLYAREGVEPWRMQTGYYLCGPEGPPLEGKPVETPWDETLASAMSSRGCAVHEESVLGDLLHDLRAAMGAPSLGSRL